MDDDIIKDMVHFDDADDNTPEKRPEKAGMPEEGLSDGDTRRIAVGEIIGAADPGGTTRLIPTDKIAAEADKDLDVSGSETAPKAEQGYKDREDYMAVEDNAGDYFNGGDEDDDDGMPSFVNVPYPEENYSFDFEYDDGDGDEPSLIRPMIKPVMKLLVPFLLLIAAVIWVMTSNNAAVKKYRENFASNVGSITQNLGIEKSDFSFGGNEGAAVEYKEVSPSEGRNGEQIAAQYRTAVDMEEMITFDEAADSSFVRYGDGVICAKTNYLCYINKEGAVEWEKNISITDPILKAEGSYFMIAQKNGVQFAMYSGKEAVFEKTIENNILTGNVSANGDVVLVTEKPGYKGAVSVYNKHGDNAFAWSSGGATILAADISPDSRRVAAALINTDNTVKSSVYLFNIKKTDSYAQQSFDNTIVYNVDFKGNNLTAFTDNSLIGMNLSGNIKYNIDFSGAEPTEYSIDDNGDKLVIFTGTNIPMINIYSGRGKLKDTISTQKIPGFAYVHDGVITYTIDREVFIGKASMRIPYKYTAAMDIKGLVPIDDKSFMVVYSNSVSMVKMKGVVW